MAKTVIVPSPTQELSFLELRLGLERCIKSAAPLAAVYPRWALTFDVGQSAEVLKSVADNGRMHAWMLGIKKANPTEDLRGGNTIVWDLDIRVWGFIGYEYGIESSNAQTLLEEECRKITQTIRVNHKDLTMNVSTGLKEVGLLKFDNIESQGFGQSTLIVAEGILPIKLIDVF